MIFGRSFRPFAVMPYWLGFGSLTVMLARMKIEVAELADVVACEGANLHQQLEDTCLPVRHRLPLAWFAGPH